jgi:hypothetical protein
MKRVALLLVFTVGCGSVVDHAPPVDGPTVDGPTVGCRVNNYAPLPGGAPGHVYLKGTSVELWHTAKDACMATGSRAYLAVPDDAGELTALRTLAGNTFWIGVHDRLTEGMFVRVPTDTLATFLPWATGEPDNVGEQDCVTATATTISTEACDVVARVYVCECEPQSSYCNSRTDRNCSTKNETK